MINNIMNIAEYKHETVSGQGSVSWDDGIKCYIPSVKVKGKAEQEMYSGVNLWNNLAIGLRSVGGVTISEVTSDHIIISTGEGYNDNGYVETNVYLRDICPTLEAGKTYYLWGNSDSVKKKRIYVLGSYVTWYFGGSHTITEADLKKPIALYGFAKSEGESVGDCRISNIMVTESSVQPNYEPYVGGMAAPNPQYPFYPTFTAPRLNALSVNMWNNLAVPITQWGEQTKLSQVTDNSIVIKTADGYTSTGYCRTQAALAVIAPFLIEGKTYTLWGETQSGTRKYVDLVGSGKTWRFGTSHTITAADLSSKVAFYGFAASLGEGTGECHISNIMITESAVQPEYMPYFDGGAVQCPEVYSMPDGEFTDIYDTQSGIFFHDIGKLALTGRESITATTAYGNGVKISGALNGYVAGGGHIGLCSHAIVGNDKDMHFGSISKAVLWHNVLDDLGMTLDDFKAWLTNQYELGSPVTIWYPLLNPTETIIAIPEKLKMPKGSGQIIQTDSGLVADVEAKVLKHS